MASKPILSLRQAATALKVREWDESSDIVDVTEDEVNCRCPNCGPLHESGRRTLNLNFKENVFSCKRCGFSGGVYRFISFYTGWDEKEVPKRVKAGELANVAYSPEMANAVMEEPTHVSLIAPLAQRHDVYSAMLERMSLTDAHRADLQRRGLTDADIDRIGFRSLNRYTDRKALPKSLINDGYDLRGVPGFGLEGGTWAMAQQKDSGYLIPLRNGSGQIQGFQIRFDHPSDSTGKYGYFASGGRKDMEDGIRASVWSAWAGDDVSNGDKAFNFIITEGALKGYIVNALTGCNVLSVPGVNALSKLGPALKSMKMRGLEKVYIAYDMDLFKNPDVEKALFGLMGMLDEMGIPYKVLLWDAEEKGIDDWVVKYQCRQ